MKIAMRNRRVCSLLAFVASALLTLVMSRSAFAELGGAAESVSRDRAHFKATEQVKQVATHSVHEMVLPSGGRLREYVSNSGTVFGVAWESPLRPDLKQLLGSYFDQYAQAIQETRQRRGPVVVRSAGLVVESAGHMRGFVGRAYISSLMPEGMTANDIQ
jgi:hypothetical protein